MRVKRRLRIRWLSLFFLLVLPVAAYGGMPEVSHVMVTDVTTTSFSVIWASSEPSTASMEVYGVEDGTVPVPDAVITPHPIESGDEAIKTAAEDNGVMKVMVTGLEPDTAYYFMTITTSKSTGDTTYDPSTAPFTPVVTESETVRTYESDGDVLPFSNDLMIEPCYLDDGVTFAEGTLLLATLEGGSYPVTAFVGDGVDSPYAIIDLNNIFGREAHENLDLLSGENLTLLNFRGLSDNSIIPFSIITHEVPEDQSLSEVKPAEFALKADWNFFSVQLEPNDPDIETAIGPIKDNLRAIWAYEWNNDTQEYEWLTYFPGGPPGFNTLHELHSCRGYWVEMDEIDSLIVNGSFNTDPIPLGVGWNMVAYRSIETVEVLDAVGSIIDEVDSIWAYEWNKDTIEYEWLTYFPGGPPGFNTLKYMKPGKAYWIEIREACDW